MKPRRKKTQPKKQYEFVVSKNNPDAPIDDIELWIKRDVKGNWKRRHRRNSVLYIFYELDDAFKFKMRWSLS